MNPFRSSECFMKAMVGAKTIDFGRLVDSVSLKESAWSTFACISVAKSTRVSELSNTCFLMPKSKLDRSLMLLCKFYFSKFGIVNFFSQKVSKI